MGVHLPSSAPYKKDRAGKGKKWPPVVGRGLQSGLLVLIEALRFGELGSLRNLCLCLTFEVLSKSRFASPKNLILRGAAALILKPSKMQPTQRKGSEQNIDSIGSSLDPDIDDEVTT